MAEHMFKIVSEEVKVVKSDESGFNSGHLWRLKNKLKPKKISSPTAMINKDGHLVTNSEDLKNATLDHLKNVLANRPIKPGLEEHQREREILCEERLKVASKNITPKWSQDDVKSVVNKLKKKRSRDPQGYSNE